MHHRSIDHFSRLSSPVHDLDARVKLFATFLFVALESSLARFDLWGALTLGLLPVFLAAASGVPAGHLARRMFLASPFVVLLACSQVFFVGGTVLLETPWGPAAAGAGLAAGAVLFVKFCADVLMTLVLVTTTPFERLASALAWWRVPGVLVDVMLMTFRYSFVLVDELERAARTSRLRGLSGAPLRRRAYAYARVLGTRLGRSLDRAERVYAAMLLRGYGGALRRVRRDRVGRRDLAWGVLLVGFACAVFSWRRLAS